MAEKFEEQPGFISTQLHKGIGGSSTFINYAVWETAAHFKNAVNKVMDSNNTMSAYPPSTIASPHLFKLQSLESMWNECRLNQLIH